MTIFNTVQAGRYLGFTDRTIRNMINRGELEILSADPIRLDARHVAEVLAVRQEMARLELMQSRKDPLRLARETRELLHRQYFGANLPQYKAEEQKRRMGLVSQAAKTLFGAAALAAAQSEDAGCRWCRATEFAELPGMWAPERYSKGFAALFGQEPCKVCGPGLIRPVMEALRAQVHPEGVRPADGRTGPVTAAAAPAPSAPRPRPAQPVQRDDDGRAWVAKRLRTERERLKSAKRRGDQRRAIQLRTTIQSLEQDAARIERGQR